MRTLFLTLLLSALAVSGLSAKNMTYDDFVAEAREHIKEINGKDLHAMMEKYGEDLVLVDVRRKEEYMAGYIPESRLVPRGVMEKLLPKIVPVDSKKKIVVYCNTGKRSAMAAWQLQRMGYDVVSLGEGYKGWIKAGYKMENDFGEFIPSK